MGYTFDTDEDTESRRRRRRQSIADLLMKNADAAPIQSPWQGAAKMANAGITGFLLGREEKRDREMAESRNAYGSKLSEELAGLGGGGGAQSQSGSMSPVTQAMMPPEQVKAIIDANVPEEDRAFAYRMAEKESAFNPAAVSPTGAKGLFQFTGGTWGDVTGQAVGRGSDGRADPVANTKAFVELTRRNREALRGVLGREPSPGELAVAHQQGVGGATALLTGKGTVNPRNLAVQAGNPKNAQDIMRYYGYAPGEGQGGPVQVAQAGGSGDATLAGGDTLQGRGMPDANRLMQIATDRNAPPEIRERAKLMLQSMPKPRDPLEEEAKRLQIQKLRRDVNPEAPTPLTPEERQQLGIRPDIPAYRQGKEIKFGPAGTSISNTVSAGDKADGTFRTENAKAISKRFNDMSDEGGAAQAELAQIRFLRENLGQLPGGFLGGAQALASQYGIKLGPNTSNIEAAQAIISKLVPTQKAPGSGTISDADLALFKSSLPALSNTAAGNALILDTMEGLALHKQKQSEIATAVLLEEKTPKEALQELRALPDPLAAATKAIRDSAKSKSSPKAGAGSPPAGVTPAEWKAMTDEERALWK